MDEKTMKLLTIASPQNEQIKFLSALRLKKNRQLHGCFLLEGMQAIITAAQAGRAIKKIFFTEAAMASPAFYEVIQQQQARQVPCFLIDEKVALRVSARDNPLTAFAIVESWQAPLADLTIKPDGLYLALDRVRDPGNLGTIIRSLAAFGGTAIILIGESVDFFSPEVARASMGALSHCAVYNVSEDEFLDQCNKWRLATVPQNIRPHVTATVVTGGIDCTTASYPRPQILLLGNEQQGLTDKLVKIADSQVTIPMVGDVESLNLAMAASIMSFVVSK